MTIRLVVTRGFGNGTYSGDIAHVLTRGYDIAAAVMAHTEFFNRIFVECGTVGLGTLMPGPAVVTTNPPGAYVSFAEAGVPDNVRVSYLLTDVFRDGVPRDFEIGNGIYNIVGPSLTRDTVLLSKINGVVGVAKISLSGTAQLANIASAQDLSRMHARPDQAFAAEVAFTDYAGGSTATLTNSPVAGNPSKWIAIDDAGLTRYFPVW